MTDSSLWWGHFLLYCRVTDFLFSLRCPDWVYTVSMLVPAEDAQLSLRIRTTLSISSSRLHVTRTTGGGQWELCLCERACVSVCVYTKVVNWNTRLVSFRRIIVLDFKSPNYLFIFFFFFRIYVTSESDTIESCRIVTVHREILWLPDCNTWCKLTMSRCEMTQYWPHRTQITVSCVSVLFLWPIYPLTVLVLCRLRISNMKCKQAFT